MGFPTSLSVKSLKAVKFTYRPTLELRGLLEAFRQMCNDAIRIALQNEREHNSERVKSRFALQALAYPRLKEYGLHSHYILSACEVAFAAYKNRTWKKEPKVRKPFLKLDNQIYRLYYLLLRIPTSPRNFLFITLEGSLYHSSFLAERSLKWGSVTITEDTVIIAFSKETPMLPSAGAMGIDVNERNVTWSDTEGRTEHVDLSEIAEIKERYKAIRAKIAQRTHRDERVMQRLLNKYGKRERDRTVQRIHRLTKGVVKHAKTSGLVVALERLTGIRRLYGKGNYQGRSYRGRMNSWSFHEIQRQLAYKGSWEGIPVVFVNPRGTSRNCSYCGARLTQSRHEKRILLCPQCDTRWDRDVNASRNLMQMVAPLVRANRPPGWSCDGERSDDGPNPLSGGVEVEESGNAPTT